MKAPVFVIDYLIVHELAHLLESNHTPRYWNIVAVQVPNYQVAKNWLRDNGNLAGGQNGLKCLYYKECSNLW